MPLVPSPAVSPHHTRTAAVKDQVDESMLLPAAHAVDQTDGSGVLSLQAPKLLDTTTQRLLQADVVNLKAQVAALEEDELELREKVEELEFSRAESTQLGEKREGPQEDELELRAMVKELEEDARKADVNASDRIYGISQAYDEVLKAEARLQQAEDGWRQTQQDIGLEQAELQTMLAGMHWAPS